jgi:hypothetical protein
MDPLAPKSYAGEWMEKLELRRYISQMAGGYLLARIADPAHVHLYGTAIKSTPFPDRTRAIRDGVRMHSSPRKGTGNVVATLERGQLFIGFQYVAGDLYAGSRRWVGNHDGTLFVHSKNLTHVGGDT